MMSSNKIAKKVLLKCATERPGERGSKDKSKEIGGFQSKKQWRKFFAMEAKGQLPKGEAKEWAHDTPGGKVKRYRQLPTKAASATDRIVQKVAESLEQMKQKEEAEESKGNSVTIDEVRSFLRGNPAPEDYELHHWAEGKGVSPHSAEELIYQLAAQQVTGKKPEETVEGGPEDEEEEKEASIGLFKLAEDLIPGGKAQGKPDSDFPSKQIRMGIKVEKEHTPDAAKAKEISKDHLEEFPNYYTALKQMEDKLKQQKESAIRKTANVIAQNVLEKIGQGERTRFSDAATGATLGGLSGLGLSALGGGIGSDAVTATEKAVEKALQDPTIRRYRGPGISPKLLQAIPKALNRHRLLKALGLTGAGMGLGALGGLGVGQIAGYPSEKTSAISTKLLRSKALKYRPPTTLPKSQNWGEKLEKIKRQPVQSGSRSTPGYYPKTSSIIADNVIRKFNS